MIVLLLFARLQKGIICYSSVIQGSFVIHLLFIFVAAILSIVPETTASHNVKLTQSYASGSPIYISKPKHQTYIITYWKSSLDILHSKGRTHHLFRTFPKYSNQLNY